MFREDKGTTEAVNAKYELMERGGYIPTGYKFDPVVLNAKLPLEFFEARNALRIAQSEGAEQYAGDSYQHAVRLRNNADGYATEENVPRKPLMLSLCEFHEFRAKESAVHRVARWSERWAASSSAWGYHVATDKVSARNRPAQRGLFRAATVCPHLLFVDLSNFDQIFLNPVF